MKTLEMKHKVPKVLVGWFCDRRSFFNNKNKNNNWDICKEYNIDTVDTWYEHDP